MEQALKIFEPLAVLTLIALAIFVFFVLPNQKNR